MEDKTKEIGVIGNMYRHGKYPIFYKAEVVTIGILKDFKNFLN